MEQQNVGSKRSATGASAKIAAKSHEAAEQLKESLVGQAQQIREKASTATAQASDRIRGVATQLQTMSDTLREDDPLAADLAQRASRGVEGVAQYVRTSDARTLVRDAEQLARRQPALFFGGAFLLGLAAGRFLKSSAPEDGGRSERYSDDGNRPLAGRQEREFGFFPQSDRRRHQQDYDVAFEGRGNMASHSAPERNSSEPRAEAYDASRQDQGDRKEGEPGGRGRTRSDRP